jgi:hypothetical protein
VLAALGRTAALALKQRLDVAPTGKSAVPGPELHETRRPLPRDLVDDYVRFVGGDTRAYRNELPPHLFPAWCMPALARTLEGLPYPLLRVVNAGCRLKVQATISDREPFEVRARLQKTVDDGRRVRFEQHVTTGTQNAREALVIDFDAIVPLDPGATSPRSSRPLGVVEKSAVDSNKARPRVPETAREIQRTRLRKNAGLSFAKLTGDFNPIHWVTPYARAAGFPNVVLHGFGSLALCWEALNRNLFAGDVHAVATFDVRLVRPLVLPREVGVYVVDRQVFLGDAPGGPAYLLGSFTTKGEA